MAPNDHLLDNFAAAKETRTLAGQLLRTAQRKTAPGSGHELRELTTGLPAVCILIACERLNTTEVSKKSAQGASCLKPKDFKRVYDAVKGILEQEERASSITYEQLHERYNSVTYRDALKEFIALTENDLILLGTGYDPESIMFKCVVYFWVWSTVQPKALPGTEIFAVEHQLPNKKFINLLSLLNTRCLSLRKRIQTSLRRSVASPTKVSNATPTPTPTPRQSPRKAPLRELPSKDSPKKSQTEMTGEESQQSSPIRRSLRNTASLQSSPSKSPTKPQLSPSKPWKKAPVRELPSKDSPKKRQADVPEEEAEDDQMDVDEAPPRTPTKKRKLESPSKPSLRASTSAFMAAISTPTSSRLDDTSPTKKKGQVLFAHLPSVPGRSSPLKRTHTLSMLADKLSSSDENELDDPLPRRRLRPVYLEHRQWNARDPRLEQIWKKAEKHNALVKRHGHPLTRRKRVRVDDDEI